MVERLVYSGEPAAREHVCSVVAEHLRGDGVVAGPSDTVYGLLARPTSPAAVTALQTIKGRTGPFVVLASDLDMVRQWSVGVPSAIWKRLERVWPGPITVVLPAASHAPVVHATLAFRVPDSEFLQGVLRALVEPVYSTSANPRGAPAPLNADETEQALGDRVSILVDGGPASSANPSTLVDFSGHQAQVLRWGSGDPGALLDPL